MVIGKTLNMVNCHKNGTWHFWEGNTSLKDQNVF